MGCAMLRGFRRQGLIPVMCVHDEVVYALANDNARSLLRITYTLADLMLEAPPWAGGLPLDGEHKIMRRYGVGLSFEAVAKAA